MVTRSKYLWPQRQVSRSTSTLQVEKPSPRSSSFGPAAKSTISSSRCGRGNSGASGTDLGAATNGIPSRIRPFNFGMLTHEVKADGDEKWKFGELRRGRREREQTKSYRRTSSGQ